MRTLIIDNVDSFTWNLASYVEDVTGVLPTVIRNDEPGWDPERVSLFDAVIISPGPGRPEHPRDIGICLDVLRQSRVPVLGVCLGHQAIAYAHGGTITRAPEPVHGRVSTVVHDRTGVFASLPERIDVVRYHSLLVSEPAAALEVCARTEDGLIMGLSHRELPQWGVQFHPESIGGQFGHQMIENFLALAAQWNLNHRTRWQLHQETLDTEVDAAAIHAELFAGSAESFWLDSTSPDRDNGRFSYLGDASGPLARVWIGQVGESLLEQLATDLANNTLDPGDYEAGFGLGWVGWLGYELKGECGGSTTHRSDQPDLAMIFADRAVVIDHLRHRTHLIALIGSEHDQAQRAWCRDTATQIAGLAQGGVDKRPLGEVSTLIPRHNQAQYLELVEACLGEIRAGETYEVCLTNQLRAAGHLDIEAAYAALRAANPTPFGALLRIGGLSVLSSSPERFLAIDRAGMVESRPIKGTRPRSNDPGEDARLRASLAVDEKDRAENLMIVDLVRNDLTHVAAPGTMRAQELFQVESYATVHQLVSTVTCRLAEGAGAVDAVQASFPGGSMTGAPKVRTMEIIDRLEQGPRGVYSGALGYFSLDGGMDLSMVIRSIVADDAGISYGVGGAVIALSDPVGEYEEIITKSAPLLRLLGQDYPG
ncbi:aminodeoxychorismate synthase component I [Corynebacterium alimapuense]|uniref:aminodeoxychorismate synthase n=1 Tax=Corynebacterium alimapuense TaxID=1576874 RepID=A0A3M8K5L4_9CORY|nr:aminodeoxychorismate synthase component I [Corynebacterium alimapuense]RNE48527.1 aminodeoxychorismate synthase, component I [Corynebacterium alimapuense]